VVDVVVAAEPLVNALDVVDDRQVEVGVERLDLVEVERGEQPVAPAERRVRVDDDVLVPLGLLEDLLEDGPAERVQAVIGRLRMRPLGTSGASCTSSRRRCRRRGRSPARPPSA
jgi:hypothetical protein